LQQYYYFGRNPRKAEVIAEEAETTLIFENKEDIEFIDKVTETSKTEVVLDMDINIDDI
jgi:hypothetical protein